jgi:hypothetical protein
MQACEEESGRVKRWAVAGPKRKMKCDSTPTMGQPNRQYCDWSSPQGTMLLSDI